MSGEEYHAWVRYYNTEPFGMPRREQMHGDLLSSLWSLHGTAKAPAQMRTSKYWQYGKSEEDEGELDESAVRAKLGL